MFLRIYFFQHLFYLSRIFFQYLNYILSFQSFQNIRMHPALINGFNFLILVYLVCSSLYRSRINVWITPIIFTIQVSFSLSFVAPFKHMKTSTLFSINFPFLLNTWEFSSLNICHLRCEVFENLSKSIDFLGR